MTKITELDKPRRGDEKDCPRCGTRIVWTGYYSFDGHWEHCDEGTSGTLSCPFDPDTHDHRPAKGEPIWQGQSGQNYAYCACGAGIFQPRQSEQGTWMLRPGEYAEPQS